MDQTEPLPVAPSTRLLTVAEAIKVLRIGKSSFFALKARGEIRTLRLGGRVLVPEREIQRLIATALGEAGTENRCG